MICEYCKSEFEARKQGSPQLFCPGGECRKAFHREARRIGAKRLRRGARPKPHFEQARQSPEFQRRVAKILASAEAQWPATPEAWSLGGERPSENYERIGSTRAGENGNAGTRLHSELAALSA